MTASGKGRQDDNSSANTDDALKLVLQCQRELAEKGLSPHAVRVLPKESHPAGN